MIEELHGHIQILSNGGERILQNGHVNNPWNFLNKALNCFFKIFKKSLLLGEACSKVFGFPSYLASLFSSTGFVQ